MTTPNRGFAALLALLCAPLMASAPPEADVEPLPGIHELELRAHRLDAPFGPLPSLPESTLAAARAWEQTRPHRSRSNVEVIGYLAYWVDGIEDLRYDVLTQVNYFSAELEADGSISSLHGWGDEASEQLVALAHAQGCRVCLVATNFDDDELHTLLSSPANRATAVDNLVSEVVAMNADGVDLDFEGMDTEDKPHLTAFTQELQAALEAALPSPWLTLATPAVDWGGAYDYDELMYASDGLFFMGYGYHWSGGDPGPLAPKEGSTLWGPYSLAWTIEDYIEYGGVLEGIFMGLPLYGRDWPSVDDAIPGEATDTSDAIVYTSANADADVYGSQWEPESTTPYYMFEDGGWHQVWYDHADSLLSKIELVADYGIGGFGFWALNYDGNDDELWDGIAAMVGDDDDDAADDDDTGPGDDDDVGPGDDDDDDTGWGDDDGPPSGHLPPPHLPVDSDGGCACSVQGTPGAPWIAAALALLVLRRRLA
jgi:spore germination protein